MIIRKFKDKDIEQMVAIWNEIVEEGIAFLRKKSLMRRPVGHSLNHRAIQEWQMTMEKS